MLVGTSRKEKTSLLFDAFEFHSDAILRQQSASYNDVAIDNAQQCNVSFIPFILQTAI